MGNLKCVGVRPHDRLAISLIRKILRFNECVLLFSILVNLLFLFNIGTKYEFNFVNSYLVDILSKWSKFPILTNNSLETSLLLSAVMFCINLPVCFYLASIFIRNRNDAIFNDLKSSHNILLNIGFQSIYPDVFYRPVLYGKGILFKIWCLFVYLLVLFIAIEWYVWLGILIMPKWLGYSISNVPFFLFLWSITVFIIISFMCSSFTSFLLIIINSIFRKNI